MREDGQRTVSILGKTPGASRILLWDDFEGVFKWKIGVRRHRPSCNRSSALAFDGTWSLRLWSGSITPDGPVESYAYRDFCITPHKKIKFELVWWRPGLRGTFGYGFYWRYRAFGIQRIAGFRWGLGTPWWAYINEDGDWIYLTDTAQQLAKGAWHRFAFSVDLSSQSYGVLESDGMRKDVSGLKFEQYSTVPSGNHCTLRLAVWIVGAGGAQYYDNILVRNI